MCHASRGCSSRPRKTFGEGRFFEFRHVIEAEVLGSFIGQAESLLAAGHHLPAASLAGAVLERALRKLCEARGFVQPPKTTIESLNAELAKAGAYSTRSQERITALAALRDDADQGKAEAFQRGDVEAMARWVRAFAADSLG